MLGSNVPTNKKELLDVSDDIYYSSLPDEESGAVMTTSLQNNENNSSITGPMRKQHGWCTMKKGCATTFLFLAVACGVFYALFIPHTPLPDKPPPIDHHNITDDDFDNTDDDVIIPTPAPTLAPTRTPLDSCSNGVLDNDESDIDCGGNDCGGCEEGMICRNDRDDCLSHECVIDSDTNTSGKCAPIPATSSPTPTPCHGAISILASPYKSTHAILWLHNNEETWNAKSDRTDNSAYLVMKKEIEIPDGKYSLEVPPGTYAVMIIDDENNNGKLDTNFLGIPSEGCGASNGASGGPFGGPKWDDAKFEVTCGVESGVQVNLWSA